MGNNWPDICAREVRKAKSEADKVTAHNNALRLVEETLEHFRMDARTYMLDSMDSETATPNTVAIAATPTETAQETNYDAATEKQLHDEMGILNEEQQSTFDDVAHCVESNSPQWANVFTWTALPVPAKRSYTQSWHVTSDQKKRLCSL